jgi:hypothetical protein
MAIDLQSAQCIDFEWRGAFEYNVREYLNRLSGWHPCEAGPLMQGLLAYLKTTQRERMAPATRFREALNARLASQPTADDIRLIALLINQVGGDRLDLSGRLKLLCRLLANADAGGGALLIQPRADGDSEGGSPRFAELAYRHGRVPIDAAPACFEATRYSLAWREQTHIAPARQYRRLRASEQAYFHDGSATGTMEILDGKRRLALQSFSAQVAWPSLVNSINLQGRYRGKINEGTQKADGLNHYSSEFSARDLLRDKASSADFSSLMTPAAPIDLTVNNQRSPLQRDACLAFARIATGHVGIGLQQYQEARSRAKPEEIALLRRLTAYFEGTGSTATAQPGEKIEPVCGP